MNSFFDLSDNPINEQQLKKQLQQATCGACVSFEGWVRNHHQGQIVTSLNYQSYPQLAVNTGQQIINQALQTFDIQTAICIHRVGHLAIGDMAIWVGVSAAHRDAAFAACRFILDEVKAHVPIWKQEFYKHNNNSQWLANPEAL